MKARTTFVAFCCLSFVILHTTAANIPDNVETDNNGTEVVPKVTDESSNGDARNSNEESKVDSGQTIEAQEQPRTDATDESETIMTVQETDGRSAYINNQYVPDDVLKVSTAPLHDLLQQQIKQVMTANGANAILLLQKKKEQQNTPIKPIYAYGSAGNDAADYSEEVDKDTRYAYKPPRPTKQSFSTFRPETADKGYGNQWSSSKQKADQLSMTNTLVPHDTKQRQHITFRTVSSATQFITTPLAQLMLKYEIGVARPSLSDIRNSREDALQ